MAVVSESNDSTFLSCWTHTGNQPDIGLFASAPIEGLECDWLIK